MLACAMLSQRRTVGASEGDRQCCGSFPGWFERFLEPSDATSDCVLKGVHLVVDQLTPNERVLAWDDSQRLFYIYRWEIGLSSVD